MFGLFKKKKKKEVVLHYEGDSYECRSSETVLDCLERNELNPPFSCRTGVCHSCKMRVSKGNVSSISTEGLSEKDKESGCFLPCVCQPKEDLFLEDPNGALIDVKILNHDKVNARTWRIRVSRPESLIYQPGQFLNIHYQGLTRSYSLASLPSEDFLEFHVMQMPKGQMSTLLCQKLQMGDVLQVSEATGLCCYDIQYQKQTLLLAGTGTGLAPIYGIARDALEQGHQANIYVYHGSLKQQDLYLMRELSRLADIYDQFHYIPCVLNDQPPTTGLQGKLDDIIVQQHDDMAQYRIFLCGNPDIVKTMQARCQTAGVPEKAILADAFV